MKLINNKRTMGIVFLAISFALLILMCFNDKINEKKSLVIASLICLFSGIILCSKKNISYSNKNVIIVLLIIIVISIITLILLAIY